MEEVFPNAVRALYNPWGGFARVLAGNGGSLRVEHGELPNEYSICNQR
jgi:hypothetical protein